MLVSSLLFMSAWVLLGLVAWLALMRLGFRIVPSAAAAEGEMLGSVFRQAETSAQRAGGPSGVERDAA